MRRGHRRHRADHHLAKAELAAAVEAAFDQRSSDATAARRRRHRQHPELRLTVPAQLAQRRAGRAERHGPGQRTVEQGHEDLGVRGAARGVGQVLGVVVAGVRKPSWT